MGERRNIKVYETSDKKYIPTPTIILKGKWLKRYGFDNNMLISVDCDNGRIVIEPREPDPVVIDSVIDGFLATLSKKQLMSLKKSFQNRPL